MDIDLNLVIGATLLCLALPSLVAAGMDRRFPWTAISVALAGAGLIAWVAVTLHGGLPASGQAARAFLSGALPDAIRAVPHAFVEIAGRVIGYFY